MWLLLNQCFYCALCLLLLTRALFSYSFYFWLILLLLTSHVLYDRRYMGHKRTIRPNAKKLSTLMSVRHEMDWDTFAKKVKACQRGFMGEPDEMRPGRGEFHEFPSTCVCKRPYVDQEVYRPPKLVALNLTKAYSKGNRRRGRTWWTREVMGLVGKRKSNCSLDVNANWTSMEIWMLWQKDHFHTIDPCKSSGVPVFRFRS